MVALPEIFRIAFFEYNQYDRTKCQYIYDWQVPGGVLETSITSSFVPVGSSNQVIIEQFILPVRGWAQAIYEGVTYPLTPSPGLSIVPLIGLAVGAYLLHEFVLKEDEKG